MTSTITLPASTSGSNCSGKDLAGREFGMRRGGYVQADRAGQLAVDVQSENVDVAGLVKRVGKRLGRIWIDRGFAQIGVIAQPEYRVSLLGGIRALTFGPRQKQRETIGEAALCGLIRSA